MSDSDRATAVVYVRMSDALAPFLEATLDLLNEIEHADQALITDSVLDAAAKVEAVIDQWRGHL